MELENKKIAVLVHQMYEDLELWYPVIRLREAGAEVFLAGETGGAQYRGKSGIPATADIGFSELIEQDFDALVIPGGYAPDKLRQSPEVLAFVKKMDDIGKPIAIICHAGWVTISAGILKNRKATSVGGIKDDMVNAGVEWVDKAVVVDKNLVSSRTPQDLSFFVKALIELVR
jgi:protease I